VMVSRARSRLVVASLAMTTLAVIIPARARAIAWNFISGFLRNSKQR
jgi:hypothetical protein